MDPNSSDDEGPPLLVDGRTVPESSDSVRSPDGLTLPRVPITIVTGTYLPTSLTFDHLTSGERKVPFAKIARDRLSRGRQDDIA
jgi:hypothetical protein